MQNQDVSLRSYRRLVAPPRESWFSRCRYLVICLAIYGGSLGASALLVNLLSRTKYPNIPEHMTFAPTLFMSGGAFIACALLGAAMAYWSGERDSALHSVIKWLLFGFAFGVVSPVITGATLPVSLLLVNLEAGVISLGDFPTQLSGELFRMPGFAFTQGVFGLFTGLIAGALFGVGALLISSLREVGSGQVAKYGPYAVAIALALLFYAVAAFGPAPTLARFG